MPTSTYKLTLAKPTRNIHTSTLREILRFPTCAIPDNAKTITSITLKVTMRYGQTSSSKYIEQNFKLSNSCKTANLSGWRGYFSDNSVYYQTTNTSNTHYNAANYTKHFPAANLLLDAKGRITISALGNQTYTFSFTPTEYGSNPNNWRNNYIYLGSYQTNNTFSSKNDALWGTDTSNFSITLTYETNSPPSDKPNIIWPATNDAYTFRSTPKFKVQVPSDPDGDKMQLAYGVYDYTTGAWAVNSSWKDTWYNSGDTVVFEISGLPKDHRLQLHVYARDTSFAEQSETLNTWRQTFYITTPTSSNVSVGDSFDDSVIDKLQADIIKVAPYYGLTKSFTNYNLGTEALAAHMNEIDDALFDFPFTQHFYTDSSNGDISRGLPINAALYNAARTELLKC